MNEEQNWTEADDYSAEEEQAYEDDLAAQNAVEDAKYDFPAPEEPDYDDGPTTHQELAEGLLLMSDEATDPAWGTLRATQAVARALLTVADPLCDALSIFRQSRAARRQFDLDFPPLDRASLLAAETPLNRLREGLRLPDQNPDGSPTYVRARVADLRAVLPGAEDVGDVAVRVGSVSPTDPAELGAWLRGVPDGSSLTDSDGDRWYRIVSTEASKERLRTFPAVVLAVEGDPYEISDGHAELGPLSTFAPFTVLALGGGTQDGA